MVKKQNCVIWIQIYIHKTFIQKMKYLYIKYVKIIHKTDKIYKDTAENVETRFDTSNHELDRQFPK